MEQENKRLHDTLSTDTQQLHARIKELEQTVKDYQTHCDYKAGDNLRKPVAPKPDMANPSTSEKSFKHQESVSEGVYHITVNTTNNNNKENKELLNNGVGVTSSNDEPSNAHVGVKDKLVIVPQTTKTTSLPLQNPLDTNNDIKPLTVKHFNGSLILNSVENFQIVPKPIKRQPDEEQQQQEKPNRQEGDKQQQQQVAPLSAPKNKGQLASTAVSKSEQQQMPAASLANVRTARGSSTSSSSNSPPLALPPSNQRKLPENVAPIPENFEDLLPKSNNDAVKSNDEPNQLEENVNQDLNENKAVKAAPNYDSGAHEIKDTMGEGDSNNLQHDDDINNFFDNDQDVKDHNKNNNKDVNDDKDDDGGNDDDDGGLGLGADNDGGGGGILGGAAAGDIAVKHNQQQQLLDDSLKNEVADDQGKEFGDGLRLDEGAMEEDDDGVLNL